MKLFLLLPIAALGLFLCLLPCLFDALHLDWLANRMDRIEGALGEFFYRITV